ncbi:MAG: hypothetical protein EOM37_07465 [Proteobacteria bacterium]|jgi:hypothetical protein|nr:hypothetical protein [Alphaproteobacteria bacterium]NCC03868.1 hypothetical protein [Pseudomonadota bacterium]
MSKKFNQALSLFLLAASAVCLPGCTQIVDPSLRPLRRERYERPQVTIERAGWTFRLPSNDPRSPYFFANNPRRGDRNEWYGGCEQAIGYPAYYICTTRQDPWFSGRFDGAVERKAFLDISLHRCEWAIYADGTELKECTYVPGRYGSGNDPFLKPGWSDSYEERMKKRGVKPETYVPGSYDNSERSYRQNRNETWFVPSQR